MPVYEYECAACGHQFEEFQKISDKPIRTCPSCKKRRVRKLISQSTFVLKGSGWYATDYGTRKGQSDKASSGESEKKADSKKESSSAGDSKSDSSTATASA